MTGSTAKSCVVCGTYVSHKPRTKDSHGRYYCQPCFEQALAKKRAADAIKAKSTDAATPEPPTSAAARKRWREPGDEGDYGLESPAPDTKTAPVRSLQPLPASGQARISTTLPADHRSLHPQPAVVTPATCPSCDRALPTGTLVCVPCGINVISGRAILTSEEGDTQRIYERAREIIWFFSWIPPWFGLFPIASEAHGTRRSIAMWFVALVTILLTMVMWWFEWTESPQMRVLKNQFHWMGNATPDAEHIDVFFEFTSFGDQRAFERKKTELINQVAPHDLTLAAYNALPESKRCFGQFHWWQPLTSTFYHDGFLHLLSNLLFLVVFGSRVNALIGGVGFLLLYPILGIIASLCEMAAVVQEMPVYGLGASGAIFGLAGMFFVMLGVSKMHVAAYIRPGILLLTMFRCRGFWILLFYVVIMNGLFPLVGMMEGVGIWAHLGGFLAGMVFAFVLLVARGVNAHGNDLLSAILGRNAWPILGKPSQWQHVPGGEGWLTRFTVVPEPVRQQIRNLFYGPSAGG